MMCLKSGGPTIIVESPGFPRSVIKLEIIFHWHWLLGEKIKGAVKIWDLRTKFNTISWVNPETKSCFHSPPLHWMHGAKTWPNRCWGQVGFIGKSLSCPVRKTALLAAWQFQFSLQPLWRFLSVPLPVPAVLALGEGRHVLTWLFSLLEPLWSQGRQRSIFDTFCYFPNPGDEQKSLAQVQLSATWHRIWPGYSLW